MCVRSYCSCWVDLMSLFGVQLKQNITTQLFRLHNTAVQTMNVCTIATKYVESWWQETRSINTDVSPSFACSIRYTEVVFYRRPPSAPNSQTSLVSNEPLFLESRAGNSVRWAKYKHEWTSQQQSDVPVGVCGSSAVFVTTCDLTWKSLVFCTAVLT